MQNLTEIETPRALDADERLVDPCPRCGNDVERVIPAGTSTPLVELMRRIAVTCSTCAQREDEEAETAKKIALRDRRVERCELPPLLRALEWDSYKTSRPGAAGAVKAARDWAAGTHSRRGVWLMGPTGVGKTRLAATAAWAALDRVSVRYVSVAELIVKMTGSFGDRDRQMALRLLTGRGPIVLDDLDKVNPSMIVLSHLYTAIDGRVQAGAPLIVTSNLTAAQLLAKFKAPGRGEDPAERAVAAEAIVSRLVGHCTRHLIEGEDGRR